MILCCSMYLLMGVGGEGAGLVNPHSTPKAGPRKANQPGPVCQERGLQAVLPPPRDSTMHREGVREGHVWGGSHMCFDSKLAVNWGKFCFKVQGFIWA